MRFFAMVEWEEKKQNQVALRTLVEEWDERWEGISISKPCIRHRTRYYTTSFRSARKRKRFRPTRYPKNLVVERQLMKITFNCQIFSEAHFVTG
jgi:hypothetical protein